MRRDLIKIFIDVKYSKLPVRIYPTKKIVGNHIDEIWSIDLAVMIDFKISNNNGYRGIFVKTDNFSKCLCCVLRESKYSQTITQEFSNIITTSNRSPLKLESDRAAELYKSFFQSFLGAKNIQHFSRFTDKAPSMAEQVNRTIRNLLKKPVLFKRNCWLVKWITICR